MFLLTLKFVFNFFLHFVKRSFYEVNKLVLSYLRYRDNLPLQNYSRFSSKVDNSHKENFCNINHYILQNKDDEFSLNLGFIKIPGNVKLNGRVKGLKSIKEIRHNYYFQRSDICMLAELDASELIIHYDGIVKFSSITQTFLMNAVLKNLKILIILKILPFEHITTHLDDVRIDGLRIIATVSGLNVISWITNLLIICTLKLMSFIILCFVEFFIKSYLNKTFSKFYLSQYNALEKVGKSKKFTSAQMKCFRDEIEITHEMFNKPKFGPMSYFYNLMRGLFEFHKVFNKVIISLAFNGNVKDFSYNSLDSVISESDLSNTQSSESESSNNYSISVESESGFDYSELSHENRINLNESYLENETDSISTENDNNETISSFNETSSENEISYQNANDSGGANNLHLEENFNESESQSKNDSREESSLYLEKRESEPESEPYEKIRYRNYHPGICRDENGYQSERNYSEETSTQIKNNSNSEYRPNGSCNNVDTHLEINCKPESDTQPTSTFNAEDDSEPDNVNGDDVTPENNFKDEDVTQPGICSYEDKTQSISNFNTADNEPESTIIYEDDTQFENKANGKDDSQPENNSTYEDVTQSEISCYEDNNQSANNFNAEDNEPESNIICEDDTQFENNADGKDDSQPENNSTYEDVTQSECVLNKKKNF